MSVNEVIFGVCFLALALFLLLNLSIRKLKLYLIWVNVMTILTLVAIAVPVLFNNRIGRDRFEIFIQVDIFVYLLLLYICAHFQLKTVNHYIWEVKHRTEKEWKRAGELKYAAERLLYTLRFVYLVWAIVICVEIFM